MGKEAGEMSQIVIPAQRSGKTLEMLQELKRKYAAVEMDNEQLRQQLAAEQAKSAELEHKRSLLKSAATGYKKACVGYRGRLNEAESTIAAMRLVLEEIRGEMICENCIAYTVWAGEPAMFCELNPRIYQYSSGTCEKWHANYDAGILAQKALSNTAGAEYSRAKKLEEALRLVLNRYHKLDTDTVNTIKAALGEGKA